MKDNNPTKNDYDDGNIPDIDLPQDSTNVPERIKTTPNGEAPADRFQPNSQRR